PVVVGHNLEFDIQCIRAEFIRANVPDPLVQVTQLCTMKTAVDRVGALAGKYPKLDELYQELFSDHRTKNHRALADVSDTARVVKELADRDIASIPASKGVLTLDVDNPSESH